MRSEAIIRIHPEVITINGDSEAWDKNGDLVTIDETKVAEEVKRLQADYDAKQYQRDRAVAYPSYADQLDMLYHQGIDGWKAEIKKVKDAHPKPE